jgi:hypothetical protein
MELTLIKTKTYKLEPYGKFVIKWNTRQGHLPNIIPFDELRISHETSMPMSKEQDKEVVKLMKKHKTDILTDGDKYYTRVNDGLTEIGHRKLTMYKQDIAFKNAVDAGHTWGAVMINS